MMLHHINGMAKRRAEQSSWEQHWVELYRLDVAGSMLPLKIMTHINEKYRFNRT